MITRSQYLHLKTKCEILKLKEIHHALEEKHVQNVISCSKCNLMTQQISTTKIIKEMHMCAPTLVEPNLSINQHQSASININKHQSASVRINQHQSTPISNKLHQSTSASISINHDQSASVSISNCRS